MIARLRKRIRYGTRVFDIGEEGVVVDKSKSPSTLECYDVYIAFNNHHPIGLFKEEVEIRNGQG